MRRALPSLSTTARHELDTATLRRSRASLGIRSGHATASPQQPLPPPPACASTTRSRSTNERTRMASNGKKKTTMAKLNRESKLRERRIEKEARKRSRKLGATHPLSQPDGPTAGGQE